VADLAQKLGRPPMDIEFARHLRLPLKRWRVFARQLYEAGFPVNGHRRSDEPVVPVECLAGKWRNAEQIMFQNETRQILNDAICTLPLRYQMVIRLYYGGERTKKEIGRELGVNESRVSQMHTAALRKLRMRLESILLADARKAGPKTDLLIQAAAPSGDKIRKLHGK